MSFIAIVSVESWNVFQVLLTADLPVYDRVASEHHYDRTLDLWSRNLS